MTRPREPSAAPSSRRGGGAMRLRGLIRKEFRQIVRDPSSIAIAFLMPLILLLLFGYGVSLDAKDVPIAVVTEHPSPEASSLAGALRRSDYFHVRAMLHMRQAERAMQDGEIDAIVCLQSDFPRRLRAGHAEVQAVVNGIDANRARIVRGYIEAALSIWLASYARRTGRDVAAPLRVEHRVWFNSAVRSRNFLVPGLIAVIMTLIGAMLTALVMAREWERGTMEALLVTPVRMREVILGKLIPYFVLGMGGMAMSVLMAVFLFGVPLRGSVWVLVGASALFMTVALGMGLLISAVSRNQFVAAQASILVTFLPAFILSGFLFDIGSMPVVVRGITRVIAARYFVAILQSVFLAGDVWSVIWPNAAALAVMAVIFLGLSRRKSRKRLE